MASITPEEIKLLIEENQEWHYKTVFNFIDTHRGWRKGKLHTILGTASAGKSTLVRSITADWIANTGNKLDIGVILSEETEADFLTEFYRGEFKYVDRVHSFQELEQNFKSVSDYFHRLKIFIEQHNIKFLIYDNITTSFTYMDRPANEQAVVAKQLKKLAMELDIPVIAISHTGANTNENQTNLISMNDIRGSKTIVNLSEFFYIMQVFFNENIRYTTISIKKHRGQDIGGNIFLLKYNSDNRMFYSDNVLDYDAFELIVKKKRGGK